MIYSIPYSILFICLENQYTNHHHIIELFSRFEDENKIFQALEQMWNPEVLTLLEKPGLKSILKKREKKKGKTPNIQQINL